MRAPLVGPDRAQVLCTCSFLRKPESRLHKVCNAGKALRAHRPLLFRASSFPRRASPWPVSLFTHPIHADACSSSARRIASHRITSQRIPSHHIRSGIASRRHTSLRFPQQPPPCPSLQVPDPRHQTHQPTHPPCAAWPTPVYPWLRAPLVGLPHATHTSQAGLPGTRLADPAWPSVAQPSPSSPSHRQPPARNAAPKHCCSTRRADPTPCHLPPEEEAKAGLNRW